MPVAGLLGVHKKGSGALTETESELYDPATGEVYYKFVGAGFAIGAHSFKDGGKNFSQTVKPPAGREPDAVVEEHIAANQAHIYRLSGDYNPLHIDPESPFVSGGGFPAPILHGLCTMGHAIRHVMKTFANNHASLYKASAVRFSSPVLPGQTLVTKMWKESSRIIFNTYVKESGKVCVSNAYVDLVAGAGAKL
jgi:acyl dehydratase